MINNIYDVVSWCVLLCMPVIVVGGLVTLKKERLFNILVLLGAGIGVAVVSSVLGDIALILSMVLAFFVPKYIKSPVAHVFSFISILQAIVVTLNHLKPDDCHYSLIAVICY